MKRSNTLPYTEPENKVHVHEIKRLWGKQKEILRLVASGLYNNKEIAAMVDVTPQTISNIIHSSMGKNTLEMLQGTADVEAIDLMKRIKVLSHIALSVQEDLLIGDGATPDLKNKIADKLLDRAGYTPISKNLNLNVNKGLTSEDLERIKKRAAELRGEMFEEAVVEEETADV
jgi:hypothetical protein